MARNRGKTFSLSKPNPASLGSLNDRFAKRMFGTTLKRSCKTQDLILSLALCDHDVRQRWLTTSNGARLIEDDGVEVFC
jgi:hypothetical protein